MNSLKKSIQIAPRFSSIVRMTGNDPKAGAIREAGGAFGRMEIAHEEEYFYKQRQEQLSLLKKKQVDRAQFHEKAIQDHQEQIKKHQQALVEAARK